MKFTERFNIQVELEEAKKRFVNRAYNRVFYRFYLTLDSNRRYSLAQEIASALGKRYSHHLKLEEQIGKGFHENLRALEAFYKYAGEYHDMRNVENVIVQLLEESEVDLGVKWEKGQFLPSGATLLDDKLVDDVLHWLRNKEYSSVVEPFEKGLRHFLYSEKRPELLADVVTDMYVALEALSKIITDRHTKDLSANSELYISKVKASEAYKKILKEYIAYANEFRHAVEEGKKRPSISKREAESFMYLTGLFIRLAIQ